MIQHPVAGNYGVKKERLEAERKIFQLLQVVVQNALHPDNMAQDWFLRKATDNNDVTPDAHSSGWIICTGLGAR